MRSLGAEGVSLQERDFEILLGLFECRVMTLAHITSLYFEGKTEAAKKRVQKLKAAGFLRERKRRIGDPSVLHLGKKGYLVLFEAGRLEGFPAMSVAAFDKRAHVSDLKLRHELEVMDVRVAFFREVKKHSHLSIVEFLTWPALYPVGEMYCNEGRRKELTIKPDGYIQIEERTARGTNRHIFFLEIDRSSESMPVFLKKISCYADCYGGRKSDRNWFQGRGVVERQPFRILVVVKSARRSEGIAECVSETIPKATSYTWFGLAWMASRNPFLNIWQSAKGCSAKEYLFMPLFRGIEGLS